MNNDTVKCHEPKQTCPTHNPIKLNPPIGTNIFSEQWTVDGESLAEANKQKKINPLKLKSSLDAVQHLQGLCEEEYISDSQDADPGTVNTKYIYISYCEHPACGLDGDV